LQSEDFATNDKHYAAGALAKAEYDRQTWQCKLSKGSLVTAQLQAATAAQSVVDGTLRAPFDGFLIQRLVEVGEYVGPSTKIANMVELDTLKLSITVPEAHLSDLKEGAFIAFRVGPYGDKTFDAKLVRISPIVRAATRDVVAEAEVPNLDHALRPGMFADAELPLAASDTPVAPKSAIVVRDGASHVFVVVDHRVEERAVQLGSAFGDEVAIVKGLAAGDALVTTLGPDIKNGAIAD
jgi:membrane fusion protein (multidrug efflux system)